MTKKQSGCFLEHCVHKYFDKALLTI